MKGKAVGHNQRVSQRGKVFGSHPLITEGRKKLNQDQPMQQLQSQVPPPPPPFCIHFPHFLQPAAPEV